MKKIAVIIVLVLAMSFIIKAQNAVGVIQKVTVKPAFEIIHEVIPVVNNTWGYNIYVNNKIKIHQTIIPGKPGNEGFKSKEDAEKVAKFVIEKMKKGEMPPAVTKVELQKLTII